MPTGAVVAALAMWLLPELWKWRLFTRRWGRWNVNPKAVVFPNLCPMCLSPEARTNVSEKSIERRTAYYVIASKMEWWKAGVPHCAQCSRKLERDQVIGFIVGGVCVVAAFVVAPPSEASLLTFCYILFGYPAYLVATTIQRAVLLGSANAATMNVLVKRPEYLREMARLNP